jgi:hypothetical protein
MANARRSSDSTSIARGVSPQSRSARDRLPQTPEPELPAEVREALIAQLMNAFVIHGMGEHVHLLQSYAAAARRGEAGTGGYWSDAYAQRWAAMFQLPPYDSVLPTRPATATCERCPETATHMSGKFPGGFVVKCDGCSHEWLVLETGL